MKKLLYSTFSIALISAALIGCKSGGDDTTTPAAKGPDIAFQTNTGTYSGYTFADSKIQVQTPVKIGVKITSSSENLKSAKMTVKFNNQPEFTIKDTTISGSTKTFTADFFFTLPKDKGTYTFTAYATDQSATTSSAKIVVTAFGPLAEVTADDTVYSIKATSKGHLSAYDLLNGMAITAASNVNNKDSRDIVDVSTTSALSHTWESQNGTQFVIGSKLNGKIYSQFQDEADVIAAWDATSGKSTKITGVEAGMLIIAKSNNGGTTKYYLIGINDTNDDAGTSDNDYYRFQYSQ